MNSLVLNLRAKTLTGTLGGKPVNLIVQPGSGLLAKVKPGRYVIGQAVNDPSAGWVAPVQPAAKGDTVGDKYKPVSWPCKWDGSPSEGAVSIKMDGGVYAAASASNVDGFMISTRPMGGWNDLVVAKGEGVMTDLQRHGNVELKVV